MKKRNPVVTLVLSALLLGAIIFGAKYYYDMAGPQKGFSQVDKNTEDTGTSDQTKAQEGQVSTMTQPGTEPATAATTTDVNDSKDSGTSVASVSDTSNASDTSDTSNTSKPELVDLPNGRKKLLLPEIVVEDFDGNKVKISDFQGKKLIINVWASWCMPCQAEMPDLMEVEKGLKDDEVLIMVNSTGINGETKKKATDFLKKEGLEFKNLYFASDMDEFAKFQANYIPTSLFVDKDGYLREFVQQTLTAEDFRKLLDGVD